MSKYPMDDILDAESDLRHLNTLIDVITDMTIDTVGNLSSGASLADKAAVNNLGHMLWIARDLCDRITTSMEDATGRLVKERAAQRMAAGGANG